MEVTSGGLVWREQQNTFPHKVTYGLSKTGLTVHSLLKKIETPEAIRIFLSKGKSRYPTFELSAKRYSSP